MRKPLPRLLTAALLLWFAGLALAKDRAPGGARAEEIQRMDRAPAPPPARGEDYVEGRIIVSFKEGTTKEEMEAVRRELRLEVLRPFSRPNLYLMRITDKTPVKSVLERLKFHPSVEYAEPDFIVTTQ